MSMIISNHISRGALALLLGACTHSRARDASAPATRSEFSAYDAGGAWRDQTGAATTLGSLRGTPTVIALMYAHCSSSCPIALAAMKRVAAEAPRVHFVLVSLDPQRDTPGALAMYAREHALSPARWTLLSGTDADVRALAAVLDVRYRRLSNDDVAHANVLTLVDATGAVVRQQAGFAGTDDTIRAAQQLVAQLETTHP
ncbi:MAG TPA: SCO family protein [Gemmatimonadaceae bacterium]